MSFPGRALPWRGPGVLAAWALWPGLLFAGWWLANMLLETGRRCSIEGCDAPAGGLAGFLWLLASFCPPAWLPWRWAAWRFRRRGAI